MAMIQSTPYTWPGHYPEFELFTLANGKTVWVKPDGCRGILMQGIAGGGSGASGPKSTDVTRGGGGSGAPGSMTPLLWFPAQMIDPRLEIVVGVGATGAVGVATGSNGNPGTNNATATTITGVSSGIPFLRTNPGFPGQPGTAAIGGPGGDPMESVPVNPPNASGVWPKSIAHQPWGFQVPGAVGGFGNAVGGTGRSNETGPGAGGGGAGHLAGGGVVAGGNGGYGAFISYGFILGAALGGAVDGQAGANGADVGTFFFDAIGYEFCFGGGGGGGGASGGGAGGNGGLFGGGGGGGAWISAAAGALSGPGGNGAPGIAFIAATF